MADIDASDLQDFDDDERWPEGDQMRPCQSCNGLGRIIPNDRWQSCDECMGTGKEPRAF